MTFWRRWFAKHSDPVRLSTRAKAHVDQELLNRQIAARAKLPENSVRPLVRDWPRDANGSPIDYEDGMPIG